MEVRVGHVGRAARLDCRVGVEPSGTVGDLRRALTDHAASRDLRASSGASLWTDDGRVLDDEHLVSRSGLRSGTRLWLSDQPPPPSAPRVVIEFAVVGGPDLGPPTVLGPGTHHIGGSSSDDIPLPGAGLPAGAVVAVVDDVGAVTLQSAGAPADRRPARFSPEQLDAGRSFAVGPFDLRVRRLAADDAVDGSGGVPFHRTPYRPAPARPRLLEPMPPPPAKRRGSRSFRSQKAAYLEELDRRVLDVRAVVDEVRVERNRALPPLSRLIEEARTRRPSLWACGRDATALLTVRLGTSDIRSGPIVEVEPGGDDALRRAAVDRLTEASSTVTDVPVALDLEGAIAVGFHGEPALVDGVVRSVIGQVVVRHGPEDVIVVALLAPSSLRAFEWLRWLPHVRSSASPLPGEHLAAWPEAVADVLGSLLDLPTSGGGFPRIVVVVHQDAQVDRAALGQLLDRAGQTGVRVLWVGRDEAQLPRQCSTVVRVAEGDGRSIRSITDPDAESPDAGPVAFTAEPADPGALDELARHLAPVRDVSSVARAGSIPRLVGLTDVLGGTPAPADIASAWSVSDGGFLDAPVGVGPDGPFSLDLVDQGPHTLIAGTSGSGKSELLRSWVAALAARHPPERLTFLFVDDNGGAAGAPLERLPHNVGVVTDLDISTSLRILTSLGAELARRATLLAGRGEQAPARDLTELAALDPEHCPPRLVLVVDEFATLLDEVPDFVAGVVDIARRGGNLGVHLILATQDPAGAVNENILANTDLRIALRMVDTGDSRNVIGSGEAADIPLPLRGRAFARIGATDLFPFQSAWSGAPRTSGETGRVRVVPLGFGRGAEASPSRSVPGVGEPGTQLDVVVHAIRLAFERSGRRAPRRP